MEMSANAAAGGSIPGIQDHVSKPPPYYGPGKSVAIGADLAPLVWRGQILTVVTLGLYRFWYRTDLRRWYWRNTIIGGTGLEYRGSARELLLGFLFALAIMVPLYLFSAYAGLFLGEDAAVIVQIVFGVGFVFLVQYGAYRSRRYRLTRTLWRGIRFDQTGSALAFGLKSLGWIVLTLLSAGLAFPLMRRALERHRVEHTRFGSAEGAFDAPIAPVMKRWLALVIPTVVCLSVGLGMIAAMADRITGGNVPLDAVGLAIVLIVLGVIWPLLLWPAYRAAEFCTFTNGTSIGGVRLTSGFRTQRLYGLYAGLIGIALGVLFGALILLAVLAPALFYSIRQGAPQFSALLAPIGVYLVGFTVFSSFKELVFNQGFWRHAVSTLDVTNLEALDHIIGGSVEPEAATGEGLADALDFGGI
jgi:uncharacterized membrane protein YjgN (DUF898 family)